MSDIYCDTSDWTDFEVDLLTLIEDTMPRETKKFMRREGGRLATATKREARATIKKKTGNYLRGVRATRAWRNSMGGYGVKVKARHNIAPHTHLIEYGHRILTHQRRDTGKEARAFHIYEKANEKFEGKFWADAKEFANNLLEEGLKGD